MSNPAGRIDDISSGHSCFPPRPCVTGSSNVIINSRQAMRVGDLFKVHCCGKKCHEGNLAEGSSTVFINGQQAGRIGDPVSCGDSVMTGSSDVFIGG